jgi:uncharacterized protein YeaO (DUF488 family)
VAIRVVRLGSARARGEGLRIGTVRRPPRGVSKADFARRYRREMGAPHARHLIATLAALSRQTDFSIGCYCADETHCHRTLLRELLRDAGAAVGETEREAAHGR